MPKSCFCGFAQKQDVGIYHFPKNHSKSKVLRRALPPLHRVPFHRREHSNFWVQQEPKKEERKEADNCKAKDQKKRALLSMRRILMERVSSRMPHKAAAQLSAQTRRGRIPGTKTRHTTNSFDEGGRNHEKAMAQHCTGSLYGAVHGARNGACSGG